MQHAHVAMLEIYGGIGRQRGGKALDVRRLDVELRGYCIGRALTRHVHRAGEPAQRQFLGVELEPGARAAALRRELRSAFELAANVAAEEMIEVAELPDVHVDLPVAVRE